MNRTHINVGIAASLVVLAASLRLMPHPDNFAPIAAVAVFGGALLPRKFAVWVPLSAVILTDIIIGFHDVMPVTWGTYAFIAYASSRWLRQPSVRRGVGFAALGSILFFLTSNFAVWVVSGMYAHTLAGLADCFWMAVPFFRNTLASDVLYTAGLFWVYGLVTHSVPAMQKGAVEA